MKDVKYAKLDLMVATIYMLDLLCLNICVTRQTNKHAHTHTVWKPFVIAIIASPWQHFKVLVGGSNV